MYSTIRKLKPGRSVDIGNGIKADRSGSGDVVRIVRYSADGFEVVRTIEWDRL